MITPDAARDRARAALASNIRLTPAEWQATFWVQHPEEYLAFSVVWPGEKPHVGAGRYVAVHKMTGEVLDLGHHGE